MNFRYASGKLLFYTIEDFVEFSIVSMRIHNGKKFQNKSVTTQILCTNYVIYGYNLIMVNTYFGKIHLYHWVGSEWYVTVWVDIFFVFKHKTHTRSFSSYVFCICCGWEKPCNLWKQNKTHAFVRMHKIHIHRPFPLGVICYLFSASKEENHRDAHYAKLLSDQIKRIEPFQQF